MIAGTDSSGLSTTEPTSYNMSFTAGSLFLRESVEIGKLFLIHGDWKVVRSKALNQNVLQSRTNSSALRMCREICQRLEELNESQLKILSEGSMQEQQQILWLAICRHHQFIHDFAVEVIREKYLQLNLDLNPEDYDAFFNAKAEWHDELERLTESTRNKLRQVVFRMLHEVGLLTKQNVINPVMLTSQVAQAVGGKSPDDLRIFPISDRDVKELLK